MARDGERDESPRTVVLPVQVSEAVDPSPDQAASFVDEVLVGDRRFRQRAGSWRHSAVVRDRLLS